MMKDEIEAAMEDTQPARTGCALFVLVLFAICIMP